MSRFLVTRSSSSKSTRSEPQSRRQETAARNGDILSKSPVTDGVAVSALILKADNVELKGPAVGKCGPPIAPKKLTGDMLEAFEQGWFIGADLGEWPESLLSDGLESEAIVRALAGAEI